MQLLSDGQINDADAKAGVGGVFSLTDPAQINQFQHIAVEQSRLHIPILFAYDTIHGYRTIFPVPLGAASSFDPTVAQTDATIGARESATVGIKQIYSPMVDVSHEPRWGRIVEGAGEDPYLGSVMAAARVKGAQGSDYAAPQQGGRPASSTSSPTASPRAAATTTPPTCPSQRLRNLYLPPFKAAIDAGADTVMCSFNAINGVPGLRQQVHRDRHPEEGVGLRRLRRERLHRRRRDRAPARRRTPTSGPCGHGIAADGPEAGANALMAGTDSEMVSTNIRDYGEQLLAQQQDHDVPARRRRTPDPAGQVPRRALRPPLRRPGQGRRPASFVTAADRAAARTAAARVDGAAQERRQRRCRSTRTRRPP